MTKEDLLAGLKRSPVPFRVCDRTVLLQPWSAATRAEFALWRKDNPGPRGLCAKLFALSVCDESGALLFTAADVDALDGLDGAALEAVADRVIRLNGMGEGDAGN